MRSATSRLAVAVLAITLSAQAAKAQVFVGTTVGGPVWNRPVAGNPPAPPLSGVGTAVAYNLFEFYVSSAGTYSFLSEAITPVNWDNYLFLYQDAFDASNQFTNILIGNDDFPSIGRSGFDYALATGTTYYLVTSGFANSHAGTFQNTIRGPGIATPGGSTSTVPEPATYLLMATGMVALAGTRRFLI